MAGTGIDIDTILLALILAVMVWNTTHEWRIWRKIKRILFTELFKK